ncbi:hypothetical protein TNCV_5129621 [Trichonephila clavipes]|nr:hypothetical protein TNCV_5129621 [Trichonephila clavipes]
MGIDTINQNATSGEQTKRENTLGVVQASNISSPSTNLTRGPAARRLFKVPPCREGTIHDTIHLQTSMSSPGFKPSPNGTAVSVANHYTGWATIYTSSSVHSTELRLLQVVSSETETEKY